VRKAEEDYYLLFNEGAQEAELALQLSAKGTRSVMDPHSGRPEPLPNDKPLRLAGHAMRVVAVIDGG
jgi:hypothetical protein